MRMIGGMDLPDMTTIDIDGLEQYLDRATVTLSSNVVRRLLDAARVAERYFGPATEAECCAPEPQVAYESQNSVTAINDEFDRRLIRRWAVEQAHSLRISGVPDDVVKAAEKLEAFVLRGREA